MHVEEQFHSMACEGEEECMLVGINMGVSVREAAQDCCPKTTTSL